MDYELRYSGSFRSREGVLWRTEICELRATAFPSVGELRFPYEEPLVLEWG